MAFQQNGTWVPDQPINATPNTQQPMMRQGGIMMSQPQAPMAQPPHPQMNSQMNPQMLMGQMSPQHMNINPNMLGMMSQNGGQVNNPVQQMPAPVQAAQQGGMLPNGPQDPGNVQMMRYAQMNPQYQPPMPQHSVMQSVNNNNPQSVQNFLSAMHQSGMGASNGWQNPQGMQGQGPQAGFQGFQQNGNPQPQQNTQWSGYAPGQQPNLGGYANQAQMGGQVSTQNYQNQNYQNSGFGVSTQQGAQGGTGGAKPMGGVVNQPTYQQPSPETKGNMFQNNLGAEAASDIYSKQNITSGEAELTDFLNHLGTYSYEYKDPKYGEGRRISPMAQEIEQSAIGKAAISTNSEGYKIVDYGKLMGTQLAALALLNHKYNQLESQLKEAIIKGLKEKGKK